MARSILSFVLFSWRAAIGRLRAPRIHRRVRRPQFRTTVISPPAAEHFRFLGILSVPCVHMFLDWEVRQRGLSRISSGAWGDCGFEVLKARRYRPRPWSKSKILSKFLVF